MKLLVFGIEINASPDHIWEVLFTQDSQRIWDSAVNEGTYFEGNWEEGSTMKFLDPENNGMYNFVTRNSQGKELAMKHLGWILDGALSPQNWEDSTVTYLLEPSENGTLLKVQVNSLDEFVDFFNSKYPQNLEKVKELSEQ